MQTVLKLSFSAIILGLTFIAVKGIIFLLNQPSDFAVIIGIVLAPVLGGLALGALKALWN